MGGSSDSPGRVQSQQTSSQVLERMGIPG